MTDRIHLSKADVTELEERFALQALRSGWVAPTGPDLTAFESEIADRVQVKHAVGLSSGTAAIHLALVAWGVGPGDVIPVPTFTFAATVNAIRYVGAEPFFVDCEAESGNVSPTLLTDALLRLRDEGRSVPAIITVDIMGKAVDYTSIARIAQDFNVRLLCDAAESLGATWDGRPAGSFGDASIVSFNGNKVLTTSGGGMLLTNDASLAAHVRKLSTQAREPTAHYEHTEVGYNYRLSNILAAVGRAQLQRLDGMLAKRRQWRNAYSSLFEQVAGTRILGGKDDSGDNCWLTALVVDPENAPFSAQSLGATLNDANIETRPVWKPMHLQPVFRAYGGQLDGTADRLFARGLTLPSGSSMTREEFHRVSSAISEVIGK